MGQYLSKLHLEPQDDGVNWIILADFGYEMAPGDEIWARAGDLTDLASIPRFLWRIAPPATGRHRKGSVIHDTCYRTQCRSRSVSDKVYLNCMKEDGVPLWKRQMIYTGLRIGGWYTWAKYSRKLNN